MNKTTLQTAEARVRQVMLAAWVMTGLRGTEPQTLDNSLQRCNNSDVCQNRARKSNAIAPFAARLLEVYTFSRSLRPAHPLPPS